MNKKISVVGVGMVGTQVKNWFERNGEPVFCFDKGKKMGSMDEVNQGDFIFICVPTPYVEGKEYDLSYLEEVIAQINDYKVVIIKSTVNPGTTDYFQQKYPNKTFLFNPEFLTELSAEKDFRNPDMQILGATHQSYSVATEIMLMLPPAPVMRVVSPLDAEWVKKFRNAFYSLKVIFFNEMFDIVSKVPPSDYETIRSIVVEDPRIGNSHSLIVHKNYRGFGNLSTSKCLPKDLLSLVDFAKVKGAKPSLLEVVVKKNDEYLEVQGLPKTSKTG